MNNLNDLSIKTQEDTFKYTGISICVDEDDLVNQSGTQFVILKRMITLFSGYSNEWCVYKRFDKENEALAYLAELKKDLPEEYFKLFKIVVFNYSFKELS